MQCPKCHYEPTLAEVQRSPGDCVKCGINYEGHARHVAEAAEKRRAEEQFNSSIAKAPAAIKAARIKYPGAQPVVVVDVNMSFWSMVIFMVKWVFATIPAAFIVFVLVFGATSIVGVVGTMLAKPSSVSKPAGTGYDAPAAVQPSISGSLVHKGFEEGKYNQNKLTFTIAFKNNSSKDVRAFDGNLVFVDLLGNVIHKVGIRVTDPVSSGKDLLWEGFIDYNEYIPSHRNLKNEGSDSLKLNFELGKVLYSDGTTESR